MTFHPLTPDQLARLSWHQRQRYERRKAAYLRVLERERPQPAEPEPEPVTDLPVKARNAMRLAVAILNAALEEDFRAGRTGARPPRITRGRTAA